LGVLGRFGKKIIEKYPHLKEHGYHMNDFGQL
jgi:hypothetical protein